MRAKLTNTFRICSLNALEPSSVKVSFNGNYQPNIYRNVPIRHCVKNK